jgi:NitT/TauT family transport system substrate-binding protein
MHQAKCVAPFHGLAIAAAILFGPTVCAAQTKLAVQMEWYTLGYHAPLYLAAAKGWYKNAGLDVTITPGTGSATTVQLLASGQSDVGHAPLSTMAYARAKGAPLIAIADFFRTGDLCLFVPRDSAIKTIADLRGKKLIATETSFEAPFIDAFLAAGGLTRKDVTLENINFATRNAVYAHGEVDGNFGTPVGTGVQIEKLRPSRCFLFGDYGVNVPSFGLFTRPAMLSEKGAALRSFASIVAGAWTYVRSNPAHAEEAIDALLAARPTDRLVRSDLLKELTASFRFLYTKRTKNAPIGVQSSADWADALSLMEKAHLVPPGAKPSDYFTNDYLDVNLIKKIGGS